jgi:hypothetical protein
MINNVLVVTSNPSSFDKFIKDTLRNLRIIGGTRYTFSVLVPSSIYAINNVRYYRINKPTHVISLRFSEVFYLHDHKEIYRIDQLIEEIKKRKL